MEKMQDMGILIVNDDPLVVRSLKDTLRKNGYTNVSDVPSPVEGLEMIKKDDIDIVLLDIEMPEMDGYEFSRRLRKNTADVQIIMLTGKGDRDSAVYKKVSDVGAVDLLTKPLDPTELLLKVNNALRIKRTEKALQESEKKYQTLIQNLYGMVFILRSDTTIESIFGNWKEYIGEDMELRSGDVPFVDLIEEDDRPNFLNLFKCIVDGKETEDWVEFSIVNRNGIRNYFLTSLTSLSDDTGVPSSVLGVAREITSQKLAEEEAKMATATMTHQRRMVQIGEMVSAIAHQWRQPLNNIMMVVNNINDALAYDELDEDKLVASLDLIQAELVNTSDVINEFRDFFKPDPDPEVFDITEAILSALFLIETQLDTRGVELKMDLPFGKYFTYGKITQMKQVILNALTNARYVFEMERIEYPVLGIDVRETDDGWVRIEIWDNGGGIPKDILSKVFDAYTTTKPPERGTGLGLYICKMIVEKRFNGHIEIENRGDGSVLTITLPQVELDEAMRPEGEQEQ